MSEAFNNGFATVEYAGSFKEGLSGDFSFEFRIAVRIRSRLRISPTSSRAYCDALKNIRSHSYESHEKYQWANIKLEKLKSWKFSYLDLQYVV